MTRKDLVDKIAPGFETRAQAEAALKAVLESIAEAIKTGESLTLQNFGTFKVVERAPRKGKNPQTGEVIDIAASKTVKFVPGKTFKSKLAEG